MIQSLEQENAALSEHLTGSGVSPATVLQAAASKPDYEPARPLCGPASAAAFGCLTKAERFQRLADLVNGQGMLLPLTSEERLR